MRYISVDIETTGLSPHTCQILEFGAVDSQTGAIFHRYIKHESYAGDAIALAMNAEILRRVDKEGIPDYELAYEFSRWLGSIGLGEEKILFAGKNFGAFDLQFLSRIHDWRRQIKSYHRYLDPAMLYALPSDPCPPDMATCMERAGLAGNVKHTAVEDAQVVVHLLKAKGIC